MTYGRIVKLVLSHGSRWGYIQPYGVGRDVFFNQASLPSGASFEALREGQVVEFDEEKDRATGSHAVRVVLGELPMAGKGPGEPARIEHDSTTPRPLDGR